jgi:F-type H+-transporting ATPase subunit b
MLRFWLFLQAHGGEAATAQHGAGGAGGGAEAHTATPFDINIAVIFWTLIVFVILLALLWKFAYPSLVRSVEERERRIQRQLDEAEAARAESARLLEEHKKLVASAHTEAQQLLGQAKQVAEKEREAVLARARQEHEDMLARARRELDEEKRKAVQALRAEAVDLALAAATKLVDEKLDDNTNRKLVAEYLASIERSR